MDWQTVMHWSYVAVMAIGALYFWMLSRNPKGVPQYEYLVAIFIPIWSGLAYLAMAIGQGKLEVAGQITHYARYGDWIVTTPLLLLSLSWTAMHELKKKDLTVIGFLMGTQVIVILTGLFADLSERDWVRYLWYICGVFAFLVVLWGIWNPLRAKTRLQSAKLARFYDKIAAYFTVLWIGYPIAWILGPSGWGLLNQTTDTFLFCLLPIFSKVGFSVLDLNGLRQLKQEESDRSENPPIESFQDAFRLAFLRKSRTSRRSKFRSGFSPRS